MRAGLRVGHEGDLGELDLELVQLGLALLQVALLPRRVQGVELRQQGLQGRVGRRHRGEAFFGGPAEVWGRDLLLLRRCNGLESSVDPVSSSLEVAFFLSFSNPEDDSVIFPPVR